MASICHINASINKYYEFVYPYSKTPTLKNSNRANILSTKELLLGALLPFSHLPTSALGLLALLFLVIRLQRIGDIGHLIQRYLFSGKGFCRA